MSVRYVINQAADRTIVRGRQVFPPGEERKAILRGLGLREAIAARMLRIRSTPVGDPQEIPSAERH